MKPSEFKAFREAFMVQMMDILDTKGVDYTLDVGDRLSNFRQGAEALGVSPLHVWGVLMNKHYTAVMNYVKRGQVESEPIRGRFLDLANYSILGAALAHERDCVSDS